MAIYGYARVSTLAQAEDGESLEVQHNQIQGYAQMHGWEVDETFVERAVSGSKPLGDRPEGGAMVAKLQAGDVVVAPKLDRVFRSALDALTVVEDFRRRKISLHLLDLGGDVSGDGLARMFLTITAAFAEAKRDRIRERISSVKADQRKRGRYLGGAVPFGYRVEDGALVESSTEQEAIQLMRSMRDSGYSLRKIAAEIKGTFNLSVSHMAVRRILHYDEQCVPIL